MREPAPARAASGPHHAGAGTGPPAAVAGLSAEVPAGPRQAPESGEFPRLESSAEFPSLEALDRAEPAREAPARPPRRRPGRPASGRRPAEAADTVSAPPGRVRPAARERTPREARRARKRVSNRALIAVAAVAVVGGAAFVLLTGHNHGVPHVVTAPNALGSYVKQPQLAIQMQAKQLQHDIVTQSAGEAKNVVYAVYEDSTGSGAKTAPQIVLFIGGNLAGTSAGSFVSSFSGKLPGAVTTSAGPDGRQRRLRPEPERAAGRMRLGGQRHVRCGRFAHAERNEARRRDAPDPADGRAPDRQRPGLTGVTWVCPRRRAAAACAGTGG